MQDGESESFFFDTEEAKMRSEWERRCETNKRGWKSRAVENAEEACSCCCTDAWQSQASVVNPGLRYV